MIRAPARGGLPLARLGVALLAIAPLPACAGDDESAAAATGTAADLEPWRTDDPRWRLPPGVAPPPVPADDPMTTAKVELGRQLFYDERLSVTGRHSCGTCHLFWFGWSDSLVRALGPTGQLHPLHTPGLHNVGYRAVLSWSDPSVTDLAAQAHGPLFGDTPIVELGNLGDEGRAALLARLEPDAQLQAAFARAFADAPADTDGDAAAHAITTERITRALAAYQRSLVGFDSAFDRALRGEAAALSPAAQRGRALFFGPAARCGECHQGLDAPGTVAPAVFANTGLYDLDGSGAYPAGAQGLIERTGIAADMGRFRAPDLRNVALTAPYMHDGSIGSLAAVVDHYAAGGRVVASGPNVGDGRRNPFKDPRVAGFAASAQNRADLVAFLEALTDRSVLDDPARVDPDPPARPGG